MKTQRHQPPTNRSMPPGVIIPELAYPAVLEAARWLCQAFGFTERLRIGNHRIQLTLGGESLIVTERNDDIPAASDHAIMVSVPDVDAHFERSRQHGASIISPPTDYPFGERQYTAEDPGGHRWTFTQSIADVDPADWGGELPE
jgi:uncharacterized glyoxalase superfamily protein PhnB